MTDWVQQIEELTKGPEDLDQLLTKHEVAALMKVTPRTVYEWGRSGILPKVMLPVVRIRYRLGDVKQMIREHRTVG